METVAQVELFSNENLLTLDEALYCEHCLVIAVEPGDKYCVDCATEVCDYLAARD